MSESEDRPDPDDDVVVPDMVAGTGSYAGLGGPLEDGLGFDLGSMMEMAQGVQQQMAAAQERLATTELVGTAGGGVVTVTLNGHLHLLAVHIDPAAVDADDPSMVEDLVLAAWQDAHDQVAVLQAQADPLGGAGGLGGLGGLFGGA